MKRFHVHLSVRDLAESLRFYSALFDKDPDVREADYAKWMLGDPKVNFAISTRSPNPGVDHLGFQVESGEELEEINRRFEAAQLPVQGQNEAECCYARSDKYWTVDPQGIAWEAFRSLGRIPVFGAETAPVADASACCVPEIPFFFPPVH